MARLSQFDEYENAEDALAAASRLDKRGDWNIAIALYQKCAQRWPEHESYITECIKRIDEKRSMARPQHAASTSRFSATSKWRRVLLYGFVCVIAFVPLFFQVLIALEARDRRTEIVTIKWLSPGKILWGSQELPLSSLTPLLQRTANDLKSKGLHPKLVVRARPKMPRDELTRLLRLGPEAGFDHATLRFDDTNVQLDDGL